MGSGGGGELLAPWSEAMGLIIQLPSLRDREGEETTWPTGRILRRPPTSSLVYGAVSCSSGVWSSGPSWPVLASPGFHLARKLNGWCAVARKLIGFWAVARALNE